MKPAPPAPTGMAGRQPPAARRAFTLIELLVVIGIFLLLMGLSVASVVRAPRLNRMLAAEQVIADCIRQSRHTARTSGQPVVLKLRKSERAIGGLMRQPLWSRLEDWPLDGSSSAPGRTGTGLLLPECFATAKSELLASATLSGADRLWRGVASPTRRPGLLIGISVRPPTAGASGVPDELPLVLVGEDLAAGYGSYETSMVGLALVRSNSGNAMSNTSTVAASWEVLGWFGQEGAGRVEVSSIINAPKDQTTGHSLSSTTGQVTIVSKGGSGDIKGDAESGALVGGRWTEIVLLVDGPRLVLYRDGRRVGEKAGSDAISLPTFATERVYVGYATIGGTAAVANGAQLDDVRLERLGDALAGTLPAGVIVDQDHRIICHPDGRVEVDATGSAAALDAVTPKAFNATATDNTDRGLHLGSDSGESAVLEITTAGVVRSISKSSP